MGRVLIVGLDGATFDLIRPWVAQGRLPRLQALLAQGTAAELRSTVPPMSPPAWSSFMTGVNPGKHGIFDFTERKPGTYEIQFVSSRQRKAETIWKILSRAGKRVCAVGVPTTYPVEAVNGVMISGFDTPAMNEKAIHPPGLYAEIVEKVGEYILSSDVMRHVHGQRIDLAVETMLRCIRRKADIAKYLWAREPWDCFMVVFGETDSAVHYFWKHHDPQSPQYAPRPAGSKYPDPILAVYQALDEIVGEFADLAGADVTLLVMSDHGAGGTGGKAIHLNRWLEMNGFLGFRQHGAIGALGDIRARVTELLVTKVLNTAKSWFLRLPRTVRKRLRSRTGDLAGKVESMLRLSAIDWTVTRAFSEEPPHYPNIAINLRGREPEGTVQPGKEHEALRDLLIERLLDWRDPETGQRVVQRVWKREEIYDGPEAHRAPDLIISWALDRGYAYLSRPSSASAGQMAIARLDVRDAGVSTLMLRHSGSHRDHGILLLQGRSVRAGAALKDANITDLAPTVLHLLEVPVPAGMDGRVLTEAIEGDGLGRAAVCDEAVQAAADTGEAYSDKESEMIRKRLEDLGYLE